MQRLRCPRRQHPSGILVALEQAIADQFVIRQFNALDAPEVLTSISQKCLRGDCATCPGQFKHPDAGDEPVLCVHECHKLGDQEVHFDQLDSHRRRCCWPESHRTAETASAVAKLLRC